MHNEDTRSLSIDKSPFKSDHEDHDSLIGKGLLSSKEKCDNLYDSVARPNKRSEFPLDQRGSVNTDLRHHRLRSNLLSYRGSVSVRSSLSKGGRSEFSFHPSINYNSHWKPKYDDHHNHKKMWNRMHKEMSKIQAKKRLASEQRRIAEMANCTFKPQLVSKGSKTNLHKHNLNVYLKSANESKTPADVKQLSFRLYQYADKFKENK